MMKRGRDAGPTLAADATGITAKKAGAVYTY
jgi:hypothetical protein